MDDILSLKFRNYSLADWKYEKIMEEIAEFESTLDNDHEVALRLASFGTSTVMIVTSVGYQNPDMLYFYGFVNGKKLNLSNTLVSSTFSLHPWNVKTKQNLLAALVFELPRMMRTISF